MYYNGFAPGVKADDARGEIRARIDKFWDAVDRCHEEVANAKAARTEPPLPPVWAMRIDTGVGKTGELIKSFADRRACGGDGATATRPLIYSVDRHKLGDAIERRFAEFGIVARVFRGRSASDPASPGAAMCLNIPATELAEKHAASIYEACCKQKNGGKNGKPKKCRHFDQCGYQRQMPGENGGEPDVWVIASDMLFHFQSAFGEPTAVVIDERFWPKGIRGIEETIAIAVDSIPLHALCKVGSEQFERMELRRRLAQALRSQCDDGGVERRILHEVLSREECERAIELECQHLPWLPQHPAMSRAEIARLASSKTLDTIRHGRKLIRVWSAVRDLLADPTIAVSGRLTLTQSNGQRMIAWRGVEPISPEFAELPTLIMDATLPDVRLLRVHHPQVEIVADVRVAMPPHTRIRQVLGAPTSATKLENEAHVISVRRYILQRWMEVGRQPTLVIAQMAVEERLRACGLPPSIQVEHYNNITGLDDYREVRLVVLVGRTLPGPKAPEALAGALTGRQAYEIPSGEKFGWYNARPGRHPAPRWSHRRSEGRLASRSDGRGRALADLRRRTRAGGRAREGHQPDGRDAARCGFVVRQRAADRGRRGRGLAGAQPVGRYGGDRGRHADQPGRRGAAVAQAVAQPQGGLSDPRGGRAAPAGVRPGDLSTGGAEDEAARRVVRSGDRPRSGRLAGGAAWAVGWARHDHRVERWLSGRQRPSMRFAR